ncbi:MAG: hypothetical protein NTY47_04395 [Candidatus Omnitrophica bacterium]|nr:hypothetical protein [Candidatus Omnitrophota bacterium]
MKKYLLILPILMLLLGSGFALGADNCCIKNPCVCANGVCCKDGKCACKGGCCTKDACHCADNKSCAKCVCQK